MSTIEKLLSHLPSIGCKYCVLGLPPAPQAQHKLCTCDDLFLQSRPSLNWRPTDMVWYTRQRRGETWHKNLVPAISLKAGLSKRYTNGSFRPTNITELLLAGFTNREVSEFTGQKNHAIIEQYKRKVELMSEEDKRGVSVLMTASGRRALRGQANMWGAVSVEGGEGSAVGALGRLHRRAVQERRGLDSLDQVKEAIPTAWTCQKVPHTLTFVLFLFSFHTQAHQALYCYLQAPPAQEKKRQKK